MMIPVIRTGQTFDLCFHLLFIKERTSDFDGLASLIGKRLP